MRNLILHKQIFSLHKEDIFLTGVQLTDLESNKRTSGIIYTSNTDILALKGGIHNYYGLTPVSALMNAGMNYMYLCAVSYQPTYLIAGSFNVSRKIIHRLIQINK